MPKEVQMWETEDGEVYDTEEEAEEHEAIEALKKHDLYITDAQIDVLHKIIDDPKFGELWATYMRARKKVQALRENQNERPQAIKNVLE